MEYVVTARSITTARGIRERGSIVRPVDFRGDGAQRLADCERRGLVAPVASVIPATSAPAAPPAQVEPKVASVAEVDELAALLSEQTAGSDIDNPILEEPQSEPAGLAPERPALPSVAAGVGSGARRKGPRGRRG